MIWCHEWIVLSHERICFVSARLLKRWKAVKITTGKSSPMWKGQIVFLDLLKKAPIDWKERDFDKRWSTRRPKNVWLCLGRRRMNWRGLIVYVLLSTCSRGNDQRISQDTYVVEVEIAWHKYIHWKFDKGFKFLQQLLLESFDNNPNKAAAQISWYCRFQSFEKHHNDKMPFEELV